MHSARGARDGREPARATVAGGRAEAEGGDAVVEAPPAPLDRRSLLARPRPQPRPATGVPPLLSEESSRDLRVGPPAGTKGGAPSFARAHPKTVDTRDDTAELVLLRERWQSKGSIFYAYYFGQSILPRSQLAPLHANTWFYTIRAILAHESQVSVSLHRETTVGSPLKGASTGKRHETWRVENGVDSRLRRVHPTRVLAGDLTPVLYDLEGKHKRQIFYSFFNLNLSTAQW